MVGSQFAGPTDNIFLCFSVESAFPKRKRIKRMEKLSNVVDAKFDYVLCVCDCHESQVSGPERSAGHRHHNSRVKLELSGRRVLRHVKAFLSSAFGNSDVRYWHLADMGYCTANVCFGQSGLSWFRLLAHWLKLLCDFSASLDNEPAKKNEGGDY